MTTKAHNILIASAWPYANGSLHIGHLAALLPADILARYFYRRGDNVLYVSGSDCHGTPISVRADREKVTPQEIASTYHKEFVETFKKLGFSFDTLGLYTTTTSDDHKNLVQHIFTTLKESNLLYSKKTKSFYCETDKRFLPDRYIEGTCPHCGFDGARGDQCDNCGRLLEPQEISNRTCKLCKNTPKEKETEHWFFRLSDPKLRKKLQIYSDSIKHVRPNTKSFTQNFLNDLHDRAITRDLDWGIQIPLKGFESKRIYVWFEAVCGYLSASKSWAKQKGKIDAWKSFWSEKAIAYYVYGKDNIPFHTVLWPAILLAFDDKDAKKLPTYHIASEYVQIEGKKLSTSRNWAIWAPDMLASFTQTQIRAALIANSPESHDTNFSWDEFQSFNNNVVIATLGNFVQRTLALAKQFDVQTVSQLIENKEPPEKTFKPLFASIGQKIEEGKIRLAFDEVFQFAKKCNVNLDASAPWKMKKDDFAAGKEIVAFSLRNAAQFGLLLEPFLPDAATKIRKLFGVNEDHLWRPVEQQLNIQPLKGVVFEKIEDEQVEKEKEKLLKTSQKS